MSGFVVSCPVIQFPVAGCDYQKSCSGDTLKKQRSPASRHFILEGEVMTRYSLKAPIRAILDKTGGEQVSVLLPAGAILVRYGERSEKSTTLFGMVGVYWEDRHYSVYPNDLLLHAERVSTA